METSQLILVNDLKERCDLNVFYDLIAVLFDVSLDVAYVHQVRTDRITLAVHLLSITFCFMLGC